MFKRYDYNYCSIFIFIAVRYIGYKKKKHKFMGIVVGCNVGVKNWILIAIVHWLWLNTNISHLLFTSFMLDTDCSIRAILCENS